MQSDRPKILTTTEAAELLQMSEKTVRTLAKSGEIPHRRVGDLYRFSRRQIMAWIEGTED